MLVSTTDITSRATIAPNDLAMVANASVGDVESQAVIDALRGGVVAAVVIDVLAGSVVSQILVDVLRHMLDTLRLLGSTVCEICHTTYNLELASFTLSNCTVF